MSTPPWVLSSIGCYINIFMITMRKSIMIVVLTIYSPSSSLFCLLYVRLGAGNHGSNGFDDMICMCKWCEYWLWWHDLYVKLTFSRTPDNSSLGFANWFTHLMIQTTTAIRAFSQLVEAVTYNSNQHVGCGKRPLTDIALKLVIQVNVGMENLLRQMKVK